MSTSVVVSVTFSIFRDEKEWTAQYIIILYVRSVLKSRVKKLTNSSEPMAITTFQSKIPFSNEIQIYKVHCQDLQRNVHQIYPFGLLFLKSTIFKKKIQFLHFFFILFLIIKLSITSTPTRVSVAYFGMCPYIH